MATAQPAQEIQIGRRERRKQELRERIIAAAYELFDEHGFHATKVSDVCQKADIAHKTFFNYFPTKQQLLQAVASFSQARMYEMIEEVCENHDSAADRIHGFFASLSQRMATAGPMRSELVQEIIHVIQQPEVGGKSAQRLQDAISSILREGVESGEISSDYSLETLTEMIMGAFYTLMFNFTNLPDYDLEAHAQSASRFLVDAVVSDPK